MKKEKVELDDCPLCGQTPLLGYACGEYFIMPLKEIVGCCVCSSFTEMHSSEELEAERWNKFCELFNKGTSSLKEEISKLQTEKHDLETQLAINKGAMRAYREAFENAHDEAVTDFSHFLIDKASDGSIDICDLPDLVAEWSSPERKNAELMKDVNAAFDKAAEGIEPSPTFCEGLIAGNSWYDARFIKVE